MQLRHLKYSRKIEVLFLPVFALMAIGLMIVYTISVHTLSAEHRERLQRTARLSEEGVEATGREMMKMANLFETNRTLKEYLYLATVLGGDREPLRNLLAPLATSLGIDDLDLYDTRGRRVLDLDVSPVADRLAEPLAEETGELPRSPVFGFAMDNGTIKIAAATPLTVKGRPVGYISVAKYFDSRYLRELEESSGNKLFWVGAQGLLMRETDGPAARYAPDRGKLAVDGEVYSVIERKITSISGKPLGMLVIALSDGELHAYTAKLKIYMAGMLGLAAIMTFVMTRLFNRTLVDPLRTITEFTGNVARGELDRELPVRGSDEIAVLSANFNDMVKQLQAQRHIVRRHTDNLEQVVDLRTEELRSIQQQLLQSQKMEAIGHMAGGIAHDFNNILTAIMGYAGMLQKNIPQGGVLRGHVDQIIASAKRAATLTNGLLAFSRKQVLNPMPVDLNVIIDDMEKMLARIIGEDIELTIAPSPTPLMIMADSGQMGQVLLNMATNARDAMPRGGNLRIETHSENLSEDFVRRHAAGQPGPYAVMTVTDTGVGVDSAINEKIFEPFFTTKGVGKGTGLGLSIVYGIVRQHEGIIELSSEVGRGTTFTLYFPLLADAPSGDAAVEAASAPRGGTETILLAEDDAVLRDLTKSSLEGAGYTVIVAADGDEALLKYSEHRDLIRLLLDVVMPKKNGKEVLDAVRAMNPDVRVIFLSGYTADIIEVKGIAKDGVELLEKPYTQDGLLNKVRQTLDSPHEP